MTTIAYKDGIMAADTMMTNNNEFHYGVNKLRITSKFLFGYCGDMVGLRRMLQWVRVVENTEPDPEDFWQWNQDSIPEKMDGTALLVDKNGEIWDATCQGHIIKVPCQFTATGSGGDYALGAMHQGATAEEAVKIAMNIDPYTGGEVTTISIDSLING